MRIRIPQIAVVYIIPVMVLAWTLYLRFYQGPYYLSNIDPEYIYLISGMNCATLDFNLIGHIDHPGTPLQLLTGLFIRIIHLFTGQQDIRPDVIAHPELYLALSSVMLAFLTFFVLLRLGLLTFRYTSDILGTIVLQTSYFFSGVGAGILARYSPDRLIPVIIVIFFIIYVKYLYDRGFTTNKFALFSGLVMGAGLMTKFNFAPLLILPLVLIPGWKYRGRYLLSLLGSTILFFLPISSRFQEFWKIMKNLVTHSGLYGSGERELVDTSSFLGNIFEILQNNPSFTVALILSAVAIVLLGTRKNWRTASRQEYLFLISSLFTIVVGLAVTAKHYKGYYAIPMLSLIPMMLYMQLRLIQTIRPAYSKWTGFFLYALLLFFPIRSAAGHFFRENSDLVNKRNTESFIRNQVSSKDYWIITPFWKPAPMPESGMVLGVSYFHHRWRYYPLFAKRFPRILTWEGNDAPLQHMRMKEANLEAALLSGNAIYLYSNPDWNTPEVCDYVERHASAAGIGLLRDTIIAAEGREEALIRYRNREGWKQSQELHRIKEPLLLEDENRIGPVVHLDGVHRGDFIAGSIVSINDPPAQSVPVEIRCVYTDEDGNQVTLRSEDPGDRIGVSRRMTELFEEIPSHPVDGRIRCYVEYLGEGSSSVSDFKIRIYSNASDH